MTSSNLTLNLRSQTLKVDENGYNQWVVEEREASYPTSETALLLCDVWDSHWCRGAVERLNAMVGWMNETVRHTRINGVQIIHAPSDVISFYEGSPARRRIASVPRHAPPSVIDQTDPPLPLDDSDGGADTGETPWHAAWTRQHPAIEIDEELDVISDNGEEIYSFLKERGLENLLVLGVHTNMCVLHRSFGIKQMVKWGVNVALIRDLTDTMYNPASSPYVSHDEGTRLVVEYIEKFWCPTLLSDDLFPAVR